MNFKNLTFVLIIIITQFSCKSSKFITANEDYPRLDLDYSIEKISIIDKRDSISQEEDIRLPFFSQPGQIHNFHPKIRNEHKAIIISTIKNNLDSTSKKVSKITVSVLEARKEFSATFSYEKELVSVKLKLTIETNGNKLEVTISDKFYRKSMDATHKKFEKLFRESLREVTYNALKRILSSSQHNNS